MIFDRSLNAYPENDLSRMRPMFVKIANFPADRLKQNQRSILSRLVLSVEFCLLSRQVLFERLDRCLRQSLPSPPALQIERRLHEIVPRLSAPIASLAIAQTGAKAVLGFPAAVGESVQSIVAARWRGACR